MLLIDRIFILLWPVCGDAVRNMRNARLQACQGILQGGGMGACCSGDSKSLRPQPLREGLHATCLAFSHFRTY